MLLTALLLSTSLWTSPSRPVAGENDPLHAAPKDALVVLRCSALDGFRADGEKNAWCKFLHDPAFAPAWTALTNHLEAARRDSGIDLRSLASAVHGRVVGFLRRGASEGEFQVGLLVEPGGKREQFDLLVAPLLAKAANGAELSKRSHADVEVAIYSRTKTASKHGHDFSFAVFDCDAFKAVVASSTAESTFELARDVIERLRGNDPSGGIDSNAEFLDARKSAGSTGRIEAFVDLHAVIGVSQRKHPSSEKDRKVMSALGVDEMRWIHATCDFGEGEDLDLGVEVKLPEQGGIGRALGCLQPFDRGFARSVPRDAIAFSLFGLDVPALWDSIFATVGEIAPEEAKEAKEQVAMQGQALGLDFEKDLIRQFSGKFAQFEIEVPAGEWKALDAVTSDAGVDPEKVAAASSVGRAYVVGFKDPLAVEGFVESVLGMLGMAERLDSEKVDGETVQFIDAPPLGKVSWCFLDDRAVVSLYPTALRAALAQVAKKDSPSVLDNPRYAPQLARYSSAFGLTVAGTPETLKAIGAGIALVKSIGPAVAMQAIVDENSSEHGGRKHHDDALEILSRIDWPSADSIDRWFRGSTVFALRRQGGVLRINLSAR
jgi:hypothetical protein